MAALGTMADPLPRVASEEDLPVSESAAHTERVTLPANRLRPGDLIEGVPVVSTSREFPQNDLSWMWIHLDDGTSLHRLETCEVEVDVKR